MPLVWITKEEFEVIPRDEKNGSVRQSIVPAVNVLENELQCLIAILADQSPGTIPTF